MQPARVRARLQHLQRSQYPNISPHQMLLYAQQDFLAHLDASGYAEQFVRPQRGAQPVRAPPP